MKRTFRLKVFEFLALVAISCNGPELFTIFVEVQLGNTVPGAGGSWVVL